MDLVQMLFRFLQYTTELPVQYWNSYQNNMDDFERHHCFLPQIQPMMTAASLSLILSGLHPACFYSSQDLLGIHLLTFLFNGNAFIVGPYVQEEWQEEKAEQTLAGLSLPASYLLPYKLYYCSYRLLKQTVLLQLVSGAITALNPELPPYLHHMLAGLKGGSTPVLFEQEPLDFDLVSRIYEQENKFLYLIETGQPHAALEAYAQMGKMGENQNFNAANTRSMIANATIIRTLARKAAERGGVHPAIVDSISAPYAQKMYAAINIKEINALLPKMIEEFGEAVRTAQQERHSSAISKVVSYITLHLSQEITLAELAKIVHISPAHLSRRFKEETGLTISQYIAQKRCQKAAELLQRTNLPVQDISAHVGYLDSNYFVKVFKGIYHMPPSIYRSQLNITT